MNSKKMRLVLGAAAAALAMPVLAHNAVVSATCTVTVDYSLNGNLLEPFTRQFSVQEGVPYNFDFSTPTRQKQFSAQLVRNADASVISIDYFNDVGTFDAIAVDTSVTLLRRGDTQSQGGRHTYSTSQGIVGNHVTQYALSCRGL